MRRELVMLDQKERLFSALAQRGKKADYLPMLFIGSISPATKKMKIFGALWSSCFSCFLRVHRRIVIVAFSPLYVALVSMGYKPRVGSF